MERPAISESLAKRLLRALYDLDDPIQRLDRFLSGMPPGADQDFVKSALGDLMGIITSDLMVPIYREHPQLGRASEPGAWLNEKS